MTTPDQNIEATPATARTKDRTEHAASSTVAAEASTAQTVSTVSAGEPSAVAESWLAGHRERVEARGEQAVLHPVLVEFQELIDTDPVVRFLRLTN
jgi:hypothetical protein